jgi:hypothetical protein
MAACETYSASFVKANNQNYMATFLPPFFLNRLKTRSFLAGKAKSSG